MNKKFGVGFLVTVLLGAQLAFLTFSSSSSSTPEDYAATARRLGPKLDLATSTRVIQEADQNGVLAAMDYLEREIPKPHEYAHLLGRYASARFSPPAAVFASCGERFEFGCYHGLLFGYLQKQRSLTAAHVDAACTTIMQPTPELRQNCGHGLGHGLADYSSYVLQTALSWCDSVEESVIRFSCYGGVFMEVGRASVAAKDRGEETAFLRADDPLFPCDAVDGRYAANCYHQQATLILQQFGGDYAQAGRACSGGQLPAINECYFGLGQQVFSHDSPIDACNQLPAEGQVRCRIGYLSQSSVLQVERIIALCAQTVTTDDGYACSHVLGIRLAFSTLDSEARMRACTQLAQLYRAGCINSAGVKP